MSVTNQQKETLKKSEMTSNDANNKTAAPETRTEVAHWLNQKDPTTFSKFYNRVYNVFYECCCGRVCVFEGVSFASRTQELGVDSTAGLAAACAHTFSSFGSINILLHFVYILY
jgi:hypothetical protein